MLKLRKIRQEFIVVNDSALRFIRDINTYINKGQMEICQKDIDSIYEIAFIKIYTSWEEFLENSFIAFLSGKFTKKSHPKKIVTKIDEDVAYNLLKGTRRYPDWTNISDVLDLSELFFKEDNPFIEPLNNIKAHFNEMKKIRNYIVHVSIHSKNHFENLVINKLTSYSLPFSPGGLLSSIEKKSKKSFIKRYSDYLIYAAEEIVKI